jgi:TRAP transporter TAXI family solute receptor
MEKKLSMFFLVNVFVLIILLVPSIAAEKTFLTISSGPVTGTWYPVTSKIAELVKPVFPDYIFKVSQGGGVYNLKAVDAGKDAQLGIANSDSLAAAYVGAFPFNQKYTNIRGISHLYGSPLHIVTLESTGITDPKQLGGKRIGAGAPGHSEEVATRLFLKEYGWTYKSIESAGGKISFIDMADAANALRDGHLDAYFNVIGPPTSHTMELALVRKIRILDIPDDIRDSFIKNNPGWFKTEIPANMYKGQTKPVKTLGVSVVFFCRADVPEEVVYGITKTMYQKAEEIRKVKKAIEGFKLASALNGMETVPLHPGAAKYYKEAGLIK